MRTHIRPENRSEFIAGKLRHWLNMLQVILQYEIPFILAIPLLALPFTTLTVHAEMSEIEREIADFERQYLVRSRR